VSSDYLTCRELVELVTDYYEGALSDRDRRRFDEHILSCPPCRAHLDQMRETIQLLGTLREEDMPPEAERTLLQAFRDWHRA
jgi:anti-sigma factor RsiW